MNRRLERGAITFDQSHAGEVLASETIDYVPIPSYRTEYNRSFSWRIPTGLTDRDRYSITARHVVASGMSERLAIRAFGEGGGLAGPYNLRILDIYKENDRTGRVLARIEASEGFVSGRVDEGAPLTSRHLLYEGTNEIVIDELPRPIVSPAYWARSGIPYQLEIDPEDSPPETDESDNVLSANLFYWENHVVPSFHFGVAGRETPKGETVAIPCGGDRRSLTFHLANFGSGTIHTGSLRIHQTGRRSRTDGRLGDEPFNEEIEPIVKYRCHPGLYSGSLVSCSRPHTIVLIVHQTVLTQVDRTLTLSGGNLTTPHSVLLNFGERDMTGNCRY